MNSKIAAVLLILMPLGAISLFAKSASASENPSAPAIVAQRYDDRRLSDLDQRRRLEEQRRLEQQRRFEQQRREAVRRDTSRRVWIPGHYEPGFLGIGRKWVEGHWEDRR